jgi:hypothetical protein
MARSKTHQSPSLSRPKSTAAQGIQLIEPHLTGNRTGSSTIPLSLTLMSTSSQTRPAVRKAFGERIEKCSGGGGFGVEREAGSARGTSLRPFGSAEAACATRPLPRALFREGQRAEPARTPVKERVKRHGRDGNEGSRRRGNDGKPLSPERTCCEHCERWSATQRFISAFALSSGDAKKRPWIETQPSARFAKHVTALPSS